MPEAEIIPLFGDDLAPVPEPMAVAALEEWNRVAAIAGWPEARFLTASRRTAMRRALKDYGGLVGWKTHLEKSAGSDFLTGKSWRDEKHRDWRPDLDWFLKPGNVVKILEDKFSGKQIVTERPQVATINWRAVLEGYRGKGKSFWHHSFGPCPEEPGPHKAPAEMIDDWRAKNGVEPIAPKPQETAEDRLRASIVAYRKVGRYEDANRCENKLAALLGRHAVHVPHPSVAEAGNPVSPAPKAEPPKRTGRWSAEMLDVE